MELSAPTASSRLPLDGFPFLRSSDAEEVSRRMGAVFSPHRLAVSPGRQGLRVRHNQLALGEISVNALAYGAEVLIDPGARGDFYMVQLPLSGRAELRCDGQRVGVDDRTLSVLQPSAVSLMRWSEDCSMILLRVPRDAVEREAELRAGAASPRFALSRSRRDAEVAAWWQAALDLILNLDRHPDAWLRHAAARAAIEQFLVSAFTTLLRIPGDEAPTPAAGAATQRCLRRAREYIHAHLDQALSLDAIARDACVSRRTLEAAFKRHFGLSPLAYARHQRLLAVRAALRDPGCEQSVTQVALAFGFVHMSRFAAQYRETFGVSPSDTLRENRLGINHS
jgi:AraC-like DNA-binding protein